MKVFFANIGYRGRWFDVKFCAKSMAAAAEKIDVTPYYIKTYVGSGTKTDSPFEGVFAKAYCHRAIQLIGHRDYIRFEEAKAMVDIASEKALKEFLKKL